MPNYGRDSQSGSCQGASAHQSSKPLAQPGKRVGGRVRRGCYQPDSLQPHPRRTAARDRCARPLYEAQSRSTLLREFAMLFEPLNSDGRKRSALYHAARLEMLHKRVVTRMERTDHAADEVEAA